MSVTEEIQTLYGVLLTRESDGHQWLAYGLNAARSLFYKRRDAVAYKRLLAAPPHNFKARVVKVRVSYQYQSAK